MSTKDLDRDLIDHACAQLKAAAIRHMRAGMGPASAAEKAIRETKVLFPADWRFGVQGADDEEDDVEVWEVEHRNGGHPIASIPRYLPPEKLPKLTDAQFAALGTLVDYRRAGRADPTAAHLTAAVRRSLVSLVKRGLVRLDGGKVYRLTEDGDRTYRALADED